jgi:hypothetical protein
LNITNVKSTINSKFLFVIIFKIVANVLQLQEVGDFET